MVGRFQRPGRRGVPGAWHKYLGAGAVAGDHAVTAFRVARRGGGESVADIAKSQAASSQPVEIEIAGAVVRVAADIAEDDLRRLLRAVREA